MSSISHFRAELRMKFEEIESQLDQLALRIEHGQAGSEWAVRAYLDRLSRQIAHKSSVREAAESVLKLCRGIRDEALIAGGGERQRCAEFGELSGWLTCAHNRACAAMDVAGAAIDEAAHAALEEWLTEKGAAMTGTHFVETARGTEAS